MAIKKSELYSSLWSSCDELRGGMDASQYKDYVLVMLFIKYVSDKYAGIPFAPITIPEGASFADMVALKGKSDIGDQINKKIIEPLAAANKLSDMPDFNNTAKLGTGKEIVDRLTNLIAIFENKALDFSKNRAENDDIMGDGYEYLMRHFATDSGKSKGQFYTPAEVSRIMAQIIGIRDAHTTNDTTVYDPTCGSGSLLLKVSAEASAQVTLYGQEKDAATSGLARMNMILHDNPTALIVQGNTLADPKFMDGDSLKTFDYVVANPPFSDKRWTNGVDLQNDPHDRFKNFGTPPGKQGDYAYLLHIIRSLKSTSKGADNKGCIVRHSAKCGRSGTHFFHHRTAAGVLMAVKIELGEITAEVFLKDIKNIHLSVYPPYGKVKISAPMHIKIDTIRVYAISKLGWIKKQQKKMLAQERETKREYLTRESHYVWGKRYLLKVEERNAPPEVELRHSRMILFVRPESSEEKRKAIVEEWYRQQLKQAVPALIEKWEPVIGVKVEAFNIRKMKTKWGSCTPSSATIRLNLELAKKPGECLEYIVVHEMVHLLVPNHGEGFVALMNRFMPRWKFHREELNRLPVRHESWGY